MHTPDILRSRAAQLRSVGTFGVFVLAILLPLGQSAYWLTVATSVVTYAILGLGLNVVVGFAGLLDLGYAAFFALGAYTTAILTTKYSVPFALTIPIGMAVAGVAGLVLGYPTLRLRSDYLAIVTLGFGEMVRISFSNWRFAGGTEGLLGVPPPSAFGHAFITTPELYVVSVVILLVTLYASFNLADSRLGYAWRAVREDSVVAEASGLPTVRLRLLAYTVGGVWGGLAGSFFAARIGIVDPQSFTFQISVEILMIVVIGGLGSPAGVILGSLVVVGVPEVLRGISQYRLLGYAVVLIVLMIVRPQGLLPRRKRRRAHHADDEVAGRPVIPQPQAEVDRRAASLRVAHVGKSFGGVKAVSDVSLEVAEGEIVGLIGPNGAGKTTLFNCITGITRPDQGSVYLNGRELPHRAPYRFARMGMARTFQNIRLLPGLTVLDNVVLGTYNRQRLHLISALWNPISERRAHTRLSTQAEAAISLVGLDANQDDVASELPYATQRRVEIARALATAPGMLFLDEPAAGMNATEKNELAQLILDIRDRDVSVVIVEHDMSIVSSICDRIVVLDYGEVLAEGSVLDVLSDPAVVEAYLGSPLSLEPEELPASAPVSGLEVPNGVA